jgi:hypothetical protein
MSVIDLQAFEVDAVYGGAAGDTTAISGPGGSVMYYDNGDGTSWRAYSSRDGSVQYYELVRTPSIVEA